MKIACGKCKVDNDINDAVCESNRSSGSHTTSYTTTANFTCWRCKHESDVTIYTDEVGDTGEVLDTKIIYS